MISFIAATATGVPPRVPIHKPHRGPDDQRRPEIGPHHIADDEKRRRSVPDDHDRTIYPVLQGKKPRGRPGDPTLPRDILPVIEGTEDLACVPAFQDARLHHPDIGDDRRLLAKRGKPRRDRVAGKAHQVRHRKIADRDRAPLPYPVLGGGVPHPLPGKVPARARNRVSLRGDRRKG